MHRITVIGGGLAGLTAAITAAVGDPPLERSRELGGGRQGHRPRGPSHPRRPGAHRRGPVPHQRGPARPLQRRPALGLAQAAGPHRPARPAPAPGGRPAPAPAPGRAAPHPALRDAEAAAPHGPPGARGRGLPDLGDGHRGRGGGPGRRPPPSSRLRSSREVPPSRRSPCSTTTRGRCRPRSCRNGCAAPPSCRPRRTTRAAAGRASSTGWPPAPGIWASGWRRCPASTRSPPTRPSSSPPPSTPPAACSATTP